MESYNNLTDNENENQKQIPFPYEIQPIDPEINKQLLKDFVGEPDGYYQVGPSKYCFPSNMKRMATTLYNFQARPDDIWIVTFPRSGTTFVQELCWLLANNLDYKKATEEILTTRSRCYEQAIIYHDKFVQNLINENKESSEFRETLKPLIPLSDVKGPRVIKSHLPLSMLPLSVYEMKCKIIYLARNSLDVAVSFYHLCRLVKNFEYIGDFEKFWGYFEKGYVHWGPHLAHVKEGWEQRHNPNLLFLFYEDIVKNLRENIENIIDFMKTEVSNTEINKLCDHLNFNNFKKNPNVNLVKELSCGYGKTNEQKFIRKGGVLNNEEFSGELKERALKWLDDNLKHTDLRFPIKEFLNK